PATITVVEDQRQYGGEPVFRLQLFCADDLLQQQADVGQQPHSHETVGGGLKLQQQVEIDPAFSVPPQPQTPDEIAVALAQVAEDEAAANLFQRGEVEPVGPIPG